MNTHWYGAKYDLATYCSAWGLGLVALVAMFAGCSGKPAPSVDSQKVAGSYVLYKVEPVFTVERTSQLLVGTEMRINQDLTGWFFSRDYQGRFTLDGDVLVFHCEKSGLLFGNLDGTDKRTNLAKFLRRANGELVINDLDQGRVIERWLFKRMRTY